MSANKLKMNNKKTKILLCGTNARLESVCLCLIKTGDNIIDLSQKVKSHEMYLENNMFTHAFDTSGKAVTS